jgi:hypothetical protein
MFMAEEHNQGTYPKEHKSPGTSGPMYISYYVPLGPGSAEEHKCPPYVPQFAEEHKLHMSVFKPWNIF